MNVTLGAKSSVHAPARTNPIPACGSTRETSAYSITDREVTCKRCLKLIADREEAAARTAYYAGLADEQDMDYSQARVATAEQAPEADPSSTMPAGVEDERCCEHADMYHGARGCDTCGCNTPYDVMPVAGSVRVGRNVETEKGRVSFRARLVEAVSLPWVLSVRPGAVITATDGEGTYCVYVQYRCTKARMLYVGPDAVDAAKVAAAYTVQHTNHVATLAKSAYGELRITPAPVTRTIYGTDEAEGVPTHDTDPRTGLPVVSIFGCRYVIGCEQYGRFGSSFVEFWSEPAPGSGSSTVFRASGTSSPESPAAKVWEAHRRIRNV